MKLGYHDIRVQSYTAGTNENGKKLMDLVLENQEGETVGLQIYFTSPESIRISLEQLGNLGWSKGQDLDCIIGAHARIEVYEDTFEGRDGPATSVKARFVRARKPAVATPMSKSAAQDWLASLDRPATLPGGENKRGSW